MIMKINRKHIIRYLFWAATLAIMILIFVHSSQTAEISSATSGSLTEKFLSFISSDFRDLDSEQQQQIVDSYQRLVRKSAHFLIFLSLGVCCLAALSTYNIKGKTAFSLSLSLCFLYASSDELHQLFVEGRSGQISDVILDTAGSLTGIIVTSLIIKRILRK